MKELELINYLDMWKTLDLFYYLCGLNCMQVYSRKTMATPPVLVLPDPENQYIGSLAIHKKGGVLLQTEKEAPIQTHQAESLVIFK